MSTPCIVLVILGLYMAAMVGISIFAKRKIKTVEDAIAAPGQVSLILLIGGAMGAHIGSGFVVGGAEYGATYGIGGAWYGIGCSISYLVVGLCMCKFVYRNKFISLSDYFLCRYQDKITRLIYSVATMLSCIAMLAGQLLAGRAIFMAVGIPEEYGVILTAVISLCYAMTSGLWGTMAASLLQSAVIFFGMFLALGVLLFNKEALSAVQNLPVSYFDVFPFDSELFVGMVVPTATVSLVSQGIYQNISSAESEKTAVRGYLMSGILLLPIALIPPLLGMFGRAMFPESAAGEVFMDLLLTQLPAPVAAIIFAAIICAILGACNGAYITVAANAVHDIYQGLLGKSKHQRRLMLWVDAAACGIGILLALQMSDIIQLLALGYSLLTSGCLVPFIGGLVWKRGTTRGALCASFVGIMAALTSSFGILPLPYPSITSVILAAVTYVVVSLVDGK